MLRMGPRATCDLYKYTEKNDLLLHCPVLVKMTRKRQILPCQRVDKLLTKHLSRSSQFLVGRLSKTSQFLVKSLSKISPFLVKSLSRKLVQSSQFLVRSLSKSSQFTQTINRTCLLYLIFSSNNYILACT